MLMSVKFEIVTNALGITLYDSLPAGLNLP